MYTTRIFNRKMTLEISLNNAKTLISLDICMRFKFINKSGYFRYGPVFTPAFSDYLIVPIINLKILFKSLFLVTTIFEVSFSVICTKKI